jgi:hypothetical protein
MIQIASDESSHVNCYTPEDILDEQSTAADGITFTAILPSGLEHPKSITWKIPKENTLLDYLKMTTGYE